MATAYTSLIGLALPVTGELSGTWGTTVNTEITSLLDSAIAGTTTLSSDADVTLTTTTGAANTSRQAIILWTAGGTVTRNITAPAQSKAYYVINASVSTQSIVLRGAGPTTGVTIVQGEKAVCAWNGTDFVKLSNISGAGSFTSLTYSTTLTGGTGIVNLGSGQFYKDASGNVGIGTSTLTSGVRAIVQGSQTGGVPQTSGTTQTYGLLRLQGTTFTSVLDFGTNGGTYNWIQATDSANLATNYNLLLNPNGGNIGVGSGTPTSGLQTVGSSSKSAFKTPNIAEVNTVSATAATGTINYDVTTQSVLYYTTNASGNFTVNFRGSSGTTLNTVMQTGESISATFLVTNGSTAYYNSAVTVDGTSVTPKWQGGTAPTSGNASSIDSYTYVIIKTGSAAFTVLAAQTKFA
jgi:hypothetical protein